MGIRPQNAQDDAMRCERRLELMIKQEEDLRKNPNPGRERAPEPRNVPMGEDNPCRVEQLRLGRVEDAAKGREESSRQMAKMRTHTMLEAKAYGDAWRALRVAFSASTPEDAELLPLARSLSDAYLTFVRAQVPMDRDERGMSLCFFSSSVFPDKLHAQFPMSWVFKDRAPVHVRCALGRSFGVNDKTRLHLVVRRRLGGSSYESVWEQDLGVAHAWSAQGQVRALVHVPDFGAQVDRAYLDVELLASSLSEPGGVEAKGAFFWFKKRH